ncbi:MAG: glutamate mutase L [Aggregatilineales bacterium]
MINDPIAPDADNKTRATGSAMAVDFGSVNTRVVVFDVVDGEYRMIARASGRTTDGFPVYDLAVGLDRVLREINDVTGRQLMTDGKIITPEQSDRTGVDSIAMTASLGRPLRAVLVGLMTDVSVASALRATAGTYIEVADSITLGDSRSEEDRLNAILLNAPDVIFIVGGTEGGAQSAVLELCRVVRLALTLFSKKRRPTVIYAGNNAITEQIKDLFSNLTTVFVAQNVRPSLEDEQLDSARRQLGEAFDLYKETRSADFAVISAMSNTGVLPTAQSYNTIVQFLGKTRGYQIAAVDVGSATGLLGVAINQQTSISIRTDLGLGHSATLLLDTVGLSAVRNWLPFPALPNELYNYAANKSLRPPTVPATLRSLYIEHALLRAAIEVMIADARPAWGVPIGPLPFDHLIGAGAGLTNLGNPGYSAMLMLDVFQPSGVTVLETDPYGAIPAMGALAGENPEAVVQLLEGNALETLGTAISATGKPPREGRTAMKITIKTDDDVYEHELNGGHLWTFALPPNTTATVTVRCSGDMNVNGQRKSEFTVLGGKLGLIFDARGRPLALADTPEGRAAQLPQWISEATGDELIEIDPAWLEEAGGDEVELVAIAPDEVGAETGKSRGRRGRRRAEKAAKPARRGFFGRGKAADDDSDSSGDPFMHMDDEDDLSMFDDDGDNGDDPFGDDLGDLRRDILS